MITEDPNLIKTIENNTYHHPITSVGRQDAMDEMSELQTNHAPIKHLPNQSEAPSEYDFSINTTCAVAIKS